MKTSILLCVFLGTLTHAQEVPSFPDPPADVSSTAMLAPRNEPGERLEIHGTVYEQDGTTPIPGFILYLYQTDASGVYNKKSGNWRDPRLHGWVRTDSQGRYTILTIKPGSYPGGRTPAHIHAVIRLPESAPRWLDSFLFQGDKLLSPQDLKSAADEGKFSNVMKIVHGEDGTLHGVRNIRIKRSR